MSRLDDRSSKPAWPALRLSLEGIRASRWAIAFLLVPAAYLLFSVAYALINFSDYAATFPYFLRYVAFPFAIASGLVAALWLHEDTAFQVGSNATAVLFALFAFESVMTVGAITTLLGTFGETSGASMHELGTDQNLPPTRTVKGLNDLIAAPTLATSLLSALPDRPVLLCTREGGQPVIYKADRYGFNNADAVYDQPIQIMVLGDSFIEGHCLPPGKDVVSRLRELRPHSANVATRGSGPLLELAALGRFGAALRPPIVVMAFYEGNDWENLEAEGRMPWLRPALDPQTDFGAPTIPAETITRAQTAMQGWVSADVTLFTVLARTRLVRNFGALQQTSARLGLNYPKIPRENLLYAQVLTRAKQIAAGWGGVLYLAYIPQAERYGGVLSRDFAYDRMRDFVLAGAKEAGVEVIDFAELFHSEAEPALYFAPNGHFSELGAEFAARTLAAKLP